MSSSVLELQGESPTSGDFSSEDLILFWPPEGSHVIFPYIKILKNGEIIGYINVLIKDTIIHHLVIEITRSILFLCSL